MSPLAMVPRPYLVDADTRQRLAIGDPVKTFRGTRGTLTDIQPPRTRESTGRVYVQLAGTQEPIAFYPSVINAEWVGRTDGGAA